MTPTRPDTAPILIADDDDAVRASLALLLKQGGHRTHVVNSADAAIAWLAANPCSLVLQDMNFSRRTSGDEGLELLRRIREVHPTLPVILITAWGSISLAVAGMRLGAADFVTKPWTNAALLQTVQTAMRLAGAGQAHDSTPISREDLDASYDFDAIVTADQRMLKLLQLVGRVAATDASVLITGESGTGKELIADALHRNSHRRKKAFVKVNLGGVSSSLFESEMFGHVRGAFTDARHDRQGRFELADGGTIFLDEIGDLDAASQVKLLRVLQDRTYEVLGSSQPRSVDVRVVSATNRSLLDMVRRGDFREDLLYRINLITVHLPALRERPADVPLLARRFVQALAQHHGRESLTISPGALKWLQTLPWPGNIRQLKQWIERAALVTPAQVLDVDDFRATSEMEGAAPASAHDPLPPVGSMTMEEIERAMILKSLRHHGGNVSRVADSLGFSRAALYRRLEKYGISV
jgi:two-component system NtrC family response regulator